MRVEKIPVETINPAPYNPRLDLKPGDPEYEKIRRSIEEFGFVEPLVWNERTGNLVGGHQRLKILLEKGAAEVECVVVDLPLEREKVLNIALNKVQGGWDEKKLADLLGELQGIPDFDVTLTGFDLPEVSELLDRVLAPEPEEDFDVEKELGSIEEPITKAGELIELGPHRLLCGDSAKLEDVQRLMDGKKAHLLFTDPPYNVDYYGGDRPVPEKAFPKQSRNWRRIYQDNLSQEEYEEWLGQILKNVDSVLADGAPVYIWNGHRQFGPMHFLLTRIGYKVSTVITWAKPNFAIGYADYNQQTEFCLYGWREGKGAHKWYGPTNETTLWQVRRDPASQYQHPTQKALELAMRAIRNSSRRGDIVLDAFLGSGTTLIAAEKLGRVCYGIEIDERYCDVARRRYQNAVRNKTEGK